MAKRPAILMGLRFLFQKKKETCDTHGLAGESDEDVEQFEKVSFV
jgi:hypothetical protein